MAKLITLTEGFEDEWARHKMPEVQLLRRGGGNGKRTVLHNVKEIAKALGRDPVWLAKFVALNCCSPLHKKGDEFLINGFPEKDEVQTHVFHFIREFVFCRKCGSPETLLEASGKKGKKGKKGKLKLRCLACGANKTVKSEHKLVKYIASTL